MAVLAAAVDFKKISAFIAKRLTRHHCVSLLPLLLLLLFYGDFCRRQLIVGAADEPFTTLCSCHTMLLPISLLVLVNAMRIAGAGDRGADCVVTAATVVSMVVAHAMV